MDVTREAVMNGGENAIRSRSVPRAEQV